MPVVEQQFDDQRHERSAKSQARLDDKPVGDQTAVILVRRQWSFVAPPSLEPGAGLLGEASVVLDVVESEGVSVEGQHVKQEEPALEHDLPWCDVGGQRLVFGSARHVNERVKFGGHTLHRGHDSPDVVHVGLER